MLRFNSIVHFSVNEITFSVSTFMISLSVETAFSFKLTLGKPKISVYGRKITIVFETPLIINPHLVHAHD